MTREEAIKWATEIKSFQEGKTIQVFTRKWVDDPNPSFSIKSKYRVKPESVKRLPTVDEVKEWFMENRVFFYKDNQILHRIQGIDISSYRVNNVFIGGYWRTIEVFCSKYTHADGTSLYITE